MQKLKSELDLVALLAEVEKLRFDTDSTGVLMAYSQSGGMPFNSADCPDLFKAVMEISSMRGIEPLHVMVNRMPLGVYVPLHRDWLEPTAKQGKHPCLERWHLPLATNEKAVFSYREGNYHMEAGYWHGPIEYWREHAVSNFGDAERIHLVVDLDSERIGEYQ